jgi:dTDP-4-dehydrorhamnose reductase
MAKASSLASRRLPATGVNHLIFRTSWVYGTRGKNFLLTMLRLGADRPELKRGRRSVRCAHLVEHDCHADCTFVAQAFAADDESSWWHDHTGVYNLTAADSTSWHGFAASIFELAGLDPRPNVLPIPASDYPTPAKRPSNSRMSGEKLAQVFGLRAPHWKDALRLCLEAR